MKRQVLGFLVLLGCGAQPLGPIGPSGPPGEGWSKDGDTVYTANSGNVGIGTTTPMAKLHVAGALVVDEDASFLPRRNCKQVTLDNPIGVDLGEVVAPLLVKNRCLSVTLKANTTWTWNKKVVTEPGQRLTIVGEGYTNGAGNITVVIQMNQSARVQITDGSGRTDTCRDPRRVDLASDSELVIAGVRISESENDGSTPLTPVSGGALFSSGGTNAIIELTQVRISSSEDVVGVGTFGLMHVRFGWTAIAKASGSPRNIWAVKIYTGWSWGGGFAFVHASHTRLGAAFEPNVWDGTYANAAGVNYNGVAFQDRPGALFYNFVTAGDVRPQ